MVLVYIVFLSTAYVTALDFLPSHKCHITEYLQRWAILKKKVGNWNPGTGSQISDVHLATRRAVSMALGESPTLSSSIASGSYYCISLYLHCLLMIDLSETESKFLLLSRFDGNYVLVYLEVGTFVLSFGFGHCYW